MNLLSGKVSSSRERKEPAGRRGWGVVGGGKEPEWTQEVCRRFRNGREVTIHGVENLTG